MTTPPDTDQAPPDDDPAWLAQERFVRFNGVDVPLRVEDEVAGLTSPSPAQREAVRLALSLPPDVLARAAPAVVQNYEVYRERLEDELPALQDPVDVWRQVTPSYFTVPEHGDSRTPMFLLMAECEWDPEHGLAVLFLNGEAVGSNQQGEI